MEKFDEDFMFELTDDEVENLRSNFLTANLNSKSRYKRYFYFEERRSAKLFYGAGMVSPFSGGRKLQR